MDIRMIAHDMRSPLSAISLSLNAARNELCATSDAKEFLDRAETNVKVLSDLVESLFQLTVDGRAVLDLRRVRPAELVGNAAAQVASVAELKGVRLEIQIPNAIPEIEADGNRLVRVLVNLLSNAIRYTAPDSEVTINARARSNDGHEAVVFSVSDHGPGLNDGDVDRIFLAGVSISRHGVGHSNGLGLAVCKELVEAHNGRIWVEHHRSPGAVFSFSIPLVQPLNVSA